MLIEPWTPRTRNRIYTHWTFGWPSPLFKVWQFFPGQSIKLLKPNTLRTSPQDNIANKSPTEAAALDCSELCAMRIIDWLAIWLLGWLADWLAWKMHKYLTVCTDNQNKATFEINFIADQQQLAPSCSRLAVGAQMLTWYAICMLVAPNCRMLAVFLLLLLPPPLLFAFDYFWVAFLRFLAIVNTKLLPTGQKCWRNCRKMAHKL